MHAARSLTVRAFASSTAGARPLARIAATTCLITLAWVVPASVAAQPLSSRQSPSTEEFLVRVDSTGARVLLRHVPARAGVKSARHAPVLFVHGSSFPSALAAAFKFDGVSWMDDLAAQGFDVWALDFVGYGGSDRYPSSGDAAVAGGVRGRAREAEGQIAAAVDFIRARTRGARHAAPRVSIVAHSWGTIVAGMYASNHGSSIERLVQFGPVTRRDGPTGAEAVAPWSYVTEADQRERFHGFVPPGHAPVLDSAQLAAWGIAYLSSDPASRTRTPASVAVPNGPAIDLGEAWSGRLAYDPARITAPVLIVRGEWDGVCTDTDARRYFDALTNAPIKRDVKISRGTHVMHLETSRYQLYREVAAFLAAHDMVPSARARR